LKRACFTTAIAVGLVSLAPPWAGAAESNVAVRSPAQTLSDALSAARAQRSVEWRSVVSMSGVRVSEATNAGVTTGFQRVSIAGGPLVGAVTIELDRGVAYLRGDSDALQLMQGFGLASAAAEANRWISVGSTASYFQVVSAGLTLRSAVAQLELGPPLRTLSVAEVDGQRVVGVRGKGSAMFGPPSTPADLYVRSSGVPLPVEESETVDGATVRLSLLKWNVRIPLRAPTDAVPFQASWLSTVPTEFFER
jgi:hypothetical protein